MSTNRMMLANKHRKKGLQYLANEEFVQAVKELTKAITEYEKIASKSVQKDLLECYYSKGLACLELDELDRSIICFDRIITINDQSFDNFGLVFLYRAVCFHRFEEIDHALVNYNSALHYLDPLKKENLTHIALVFLKQGEIYLSKEDYEASIDPLTNSIKVYLTKDESDMISEKSNVAQINIGLAYGQRSVAYLRCQRFTEALAGFQLALKYFQDIPPTRFINKQIAINYHNWAFAYQMQTDWDASMIVYDKAIELFRLIENWEEDIYDIMRLAEAHTQKADIYVKKKQFELAIVELENAIDLYKMLLDKESKSSGLLLLAITYMKICLIYVDLENRDMAVDYFHKTIEACDSLPWYAKKIPVEVRTVLDEARRLLNLESCSCGCLSFFQYQEHLESKPESEWDNGLLDMFNTSPLKQHSHVNKPESSISLGATLKMVYNNKK